METKHSVYRFMEVFLLLAQEVVFSHPIILASCLGRSMHRADGFVNVILFRMALVT